GQSQLVGSREVSGMGKVVSFSINHQAWVPELEVPFVVAIVELQEQAGLRFVSNVVGCAPEAVSIGMPVQVRFEPVEDVWIPLFEPAEFSNSGSAA
ncbi:MAG: OB-fold domain-containing protein, partial [Rhodoferax sp.]|nr:OB-fold domain-containing protein [Rhodoferax sp.]